MKKLIFLLILLIIPIVSSIDNCNREITDVDTPCLLLLHVTPGTVCSDLQVDVYRNNSGFIYSQQMDSYSPFICNATFNQSNFGTYTGNYTTGDAFSIILKEDNNIRIDLYWIAFFLILGLLLLGHKTEQPMYPTLSGFILVVAAIDIFLNGFPNSTNEFLKNVVVTALAGLGLFLIIAPYTEDITNMLNK